MFFPFDITGLMLARVYDIVAGIVVEVAVMDFAVSMKVDMVVDIAMGIAVGIAMGMDMDVVDFAMDIALDFAFDIVGSSSNLMCLPFGFQYLDLLQYGMLDQLFPQSKGRHF